jgi:uncharacterized protein (DUF1015 family)
MPAMPAADHARRGLDVRPFRGVRYDPAQVGDLAAVTSPPYDVIDPDSASHLEDLDPHNVVRLILPRDVGADSASRYAQAGSALHEWTSKGVLVRDERPSLYVYEQSAAGVAQRGLLAAVALRDPEERVILPHEDVMPGPVADRLELMRATSANLEPILLVYDGGGDTAAVIDDVIDRGAAGPPVIATRTEDGLEQRVWAVDAPDLHERVARDLAPRQALIADGHHRYATYRRLQAEHHARGDGAGDWDLGLAMLVDSRSHPPHVSAIHRVVGDLQLGQALARATTVFTTRPSGPDLTSALATLDAAPGTHPFVLTDGSSFALIEDPRPDAVGAVLPESGPAAHSDAWRSLDASVLHALLLRDLWDVDDDSRRTLYLHDAESAVRSAVRERGVAVLMRPVTVDLVRSLAARGERMPRKSTSFGPKPRTGLVLRILDGATRA